MPLMMTMMTTASSLETYNYLRGVQKKINRLRNCKNAYGGQMCGRILLEQIPLLVD